MTTPSPIPEKSTSGISVDPRTLNRVVPESRRPDGRYVYNTAQFFPCLIVFHSVRKEIKIRPGFTPQEDVTRFRGTRQTQMDRIALPEGHILGWVAPSSASKPKPSASSNPTSKSAKKNEKRKAKRDKIKEEVIRSNWEDDDEDVIKDDDGAPNWAETAKVQGRKAELNTSGKKVAAEGHEEPAAGKVNGNGEPLTPGTDELGQKLEHLQLH